MNEETNKDVRHLNVKFDVQNSPEKNDSEEKKSDDVWDQLLNKDDAEDAKTGAGGNQKEERGEEDAALPDADFLVIDDLTEEKPSGDLKDAMRPLTEKLEGIEGQLAQLRQEFQGKLKYDAHKDKIIDNLHKELQEYKKDVIKKHMQSIVMDMIKIIDNIRRLTEHYNAQDPSESDPQKLLNLLEGVPSDLEDLFYYQGITPYTCNASAFDPSRQRLLKTVQTADKSLDKTVAESLRPGYEWDDKILRPEMVAVYVYDAASENSNTEQSDE